MEFFASIRMNDTHYKNQNFQPWMPQYYYDNLHNRVSNDLTAHQTGNEFDYRKSAVREHYLDQIAGAEVRRGRRRAGHDAQLRLFPKAYAEECAPIMTQFLRQVRGVLDEAGKVHGRRLELAVAIPYSLYRASRKASMSRHGRGWGSLICSACRRLFSSRPSAISRTRC